MDVLCGINPVLEALRARSREFDRLIIAKGARNRRVSEAIREATRLGIPLRFEIREALDRIAQGLNHQGVVAVVSAKPLLDLESLINEAHDPALIIALDGIEDPRNLGAILRTAEAARADGIVLPDRRSVGLTDAASRASAGALEHVRVARVGNLVQALERLKQHGMWVVGFDAMAGERWHEADMTRGVALVFGGEGRGIRRLVREHCDHVVSLPMLGRVGSLNVSVAAGIALYEVVRQRGWAPSHVRPIPTKSNGHAAETKVIGPGPDDDEEDPGRIAPLGTIETDGDESMESADDPPTIHVLGLDDAIEWTFGESQTRVIRKRRSGRQRWFERRRKRMGLAIASYGDQKTACEKPNVTPNVTRTPSLKSRRPHRRRRGRTPAGDPSSTTAAISVSESAKGGVDHPPEAPRAKNRRKRHGRRRRP